MKTKTKIRPRYEMKNVPEWAIKELRDYAEERGIERGEAFGEVMESRKEQRKLLKECFDHLTSIALGNEASMHHVTNLLSEISDNLGEE